MTIEFVGLSAALIMLVVAKAGLLLADRQPGRSRFAEQPDRDCQVGQPAMLGCD